MKYITVEQAVEAVRKCSRTMLLGQVEVVVAALRTLPQAEPTAEEVERVAMAIYHFDYDEPPWHEQCDRITAGYWESARAAIAAIYGDAIYGEGSRG